jgi:energy-converting hydrogenase A subunit R
MRIYVTDCEGPVSKNDNAMELAAEYIPDGHRFFALVSKYDDYLAYVEKRPGYNAGDTLSLILPFLKAHGATDEGIEQYSQEHILLVPGADETVRHVSGLMPAFMISTSYEPYIRALCQALSFPADHAYCTRVALDGYPIQGDQEEYLRKLAAEIARMPMLDWPEDARGMVDLAPAAQQVVGRLNHIFWSELSAMAIGAMLRDVRPIGGEGKVEAVKDILRTTGADLSAVMYVGDSITDLRVLELVRKGGGLAVSFNGNRYAIEGAGVAVAGPATNGVSAVASVFNRGGRDLVLSVLREGRHAGRDLGAEAEELTDYTMRGEVGEVTPDSRPAWVEKSQKMRRQVRGVQIATLG